MKYPQTDCGRLALSVLGISGYVVLLVTFNSGIFQPGQRYVMELSTNGTRQWDYARNGTRQREYARNGTRPREYARYGTRPREYARNGTKEQEHIREISSPTSNSSSLDGKILCPETPPGLVGPIKPYMKLKALSQLAEDHPELDAGGRWRPKNCTARHRVAILIPYRKRKEHLRILLNNLHVFLQKQLLDYGVYVVEQAGVALFNRAKLFNVGYREALKDANWECFVFHDVDHVPLNDHNSYTCPSRPTHLSVAASKFGYRMPYPTFFGGVSVLNREDFERINGFSNIYWGWGGEDDDLYHRVAAEGLLPILRPPSGVGRYQTLTLYHQSAPPDTLRFQKLAAARSRQKRDGLSNLRYELVDKKYQKLYTYIMADLGSNPS